MIYELNTKKMLEVTQNLDDWVKLGFSFKIDTWRKSKYRKAGSAILFVNRYGEVMRSVVISDAIYKNVAGDYYDIVK